MGTREIIAKGNSVPESERMQDFKRGLMNALPAILLSVLILVSWEVLVAIFDIQQFLLPAPSAIINAFITHLAELQVSARLALIEAAGGLVIGSVLGIAGGLIAVRWKVAGRASFPLLSG